MSTDRTIDEGTDATGTTDGTGTGEGQDGPPHHASGLMPAQDDAALAEVDPERIPETDAFGRTRDER